MESIKNKLQDLKSLFDSKLITEEEYVTLKNEILFKIDLDEQPQKDFKSNYINNDFYDSKTPKSKTNSTGIYIVIGLCIAFYFAFLSSKDNTKDNILIETQTTKVDVPELVTTNPTEVCNICGKTFHNRGYEEVSEGVFKEIEEGQGWMCSPSCVRRHNQNLIDLARKYSTSSNNSIIHETGNSGYHEGNDGMIYENSPCELCRGTGYEINTAQRVLGGPSRRICPMCQGKGVMSY